ncbi:carboxy terminal-processing peptidase [Pedobacter insulae]|uniref:C-terminal processing peptidase-1. Serine peptidase. MEROPS family S41A n=1 Tax=Pedobacter insulae TaxID=414048 RepID=A0A1I2YSK1_9SPHI|nr:carboxy terminal-processing peptidase [Pedobacter insulae]SFH28622.1 C-terminal processing peptidase-1. Serine peptidase. MEROPS family S41A [Pedobacter insulae]
MDFKLFKEMLRRVLMVTFTAAALACSAAPEVQKMVDGVQNIKPDEQQSLVCKELVGLIENYNYKKIKINDSISSIVLDRYIKALDPSKYYFLASDIKEFEKYRTTLDDAFRIGDLSGPFYIFNVYLKRYNERINYSIAQIGNKYDFTQNDTYVYDREKMPWISSTSALDEVWKKRVKYELVNLKIAGADPAKNVETLTKRYENLKSQAAKFNNQDVFQIVMDSFTEAIDPHTNYFNPRNAEVFNQEMSRSIEGIGATLQLDNEVTKVMSIVPGGPAFKSKLLNAGDRIVAVAQGVDGEFVDIVGWRIDNAVSKIKGPKGTTVRLKVIPVGQELSAKPVVITLVREKVILADQSAKKSVKTIQSDGKPFKIGIIDVPAFYADFKAANAGDPNYKSTTRDVRLLIDSLKSIDKVDAIVMDLRANGGGSLVEAIDLTGLFIDKGPVVQVKDLRSAVDVNEDKNPGVVWNGPLGVIVDRLSASASEIFAGAIQDYGRGIVMGTQTYGKGTVQSSIDMNRLFKQSFLQEISAALKPKVKTTPVSSGNTAGVAAPVVDKDGIIQFGQVNLTMGKFYRVNGSSTQHKGVIPDINFPSVYPMDKIGEDTEPSALPFDVVKPSNYTSVADLSAIKADLLKLHEQRMAKSVNYKVLVEDIAEGKKRDNETTVTLNEAKLKAERDLLEAKVLARTNQLREAKGLPLLKKGDKPTKEEAFDFVQDESLKVMVDFMKLSGIDQKLTNNINPVINK